VSTYDRIGVGYSSRRQPDPRIADALEDALGLASTVVDVGSGTGSYQLSGRSVVGVEPSQTMIDQRPAGSAAVIRAVAENLPVRSGVFDAALAVLTVHHWEDHVGGLEELARVAARQVILTWDPDTFSRFWLVADYLPEIATRESTLATLEAVVDVLEVREVRPVLVPADCTDGFCGAYWRRPAEYLDPSVRSAISAFARCDPDAVVTAMARLEEDLVSGAWVRRYDGLLHRGEIDLGYRIVLCDGIRSRGG